VELVQQVKKLADFESPFSVIQTFEKTLAEYTGAPYAITVDHCSHAIEMCMYVEGVKQCSFPAYTYLSVLMTMVKLGIEYTLLDKKWNPSYQFLGTRIWDCARQLQPNMYRPNSLQCLSFNRQKPLAVGIGGAILLDDEKLYKRLSRMRYDGRDIFSYSSWIDQGEFELGFHYYMRPEEALIALNKLEQRDFVEQKPKYFDYPDCRKISIINV
jgi:dTDP-4-amino-4,6-dideoxygalactose transaminase